MAKAIYCRDTGSNCPFVARAETVEELLAKVAEHAKTAHAITQIDPGLLERVKSAIRDE